MNAQQPQPCPACGGRGTGGTCGWCGGSGFVIDINRNPHNNHVPDAVAPESSMAPANTVVEPV